MKPNKKGKGKRDKDFDCEEMGDTSAWDGMSAENGDCLSQGQQYWPGDKCKDSELFSYFNTEEYQLLSAGQKKRDLWNRLNAVTIPRC